MNTISRAMKIERESAAKEAASYRFETDIASSDITPGDVAYLQRYSESKAPVNGCYAMWRKSVYTPVKVLNVVGDSLTYVSNTGRTTVRGRNHFEKEAEIAKKKEFFERLTHEEGFIRVYMNRHKKITVEDVIEYRKSIVRRKIDVFAFDEKKLREAVSSHNNRVPTA